MWKILDEIELRLKNYVQFGFGIVVMLCIVMLVENHILSKRLDEEIAKKQPCLTLLTNGEATLNIDGDLTLDKFSIGSNASAHFNKAKVVFNNSFSDSGRAASMPQEVCAKKEN
jgi:hypothetical protein